ncbi:MAG: DUF624 domain-containing protein [Anaerolinea sp.]|nr:DUF624 domain-containing protein [Anaerolinea sp.]
MNPFRALLHASRLWWKEWIGMILLNILWALLQAPVVTGPPATAVLYAIARKVYDDEVWELPELWTELRRLFWPAWQWALPNLLVGGALVWNFYAFQGAQGSAWLALRLAWGALLLLWFMLNLFYWPFWLAQEDKSVRVTYVNCGRFLLRHGWAALFLAVVCSLVLTVSLWTAVPLSAGAVCWLALVGETAVRRSLTERR